MDIVEVVVLVVSLCMIVPLGIITTIQDIKHNKLKNKWILIGIIGGLIINFAIVGYLFYTNSPSKVFYIKEYLLNFVFAFLVGFMIWEGSLWSAGDAKLFLAFAALVPLTVYQWGYIRTFPSSVLLINTFTPYFLFYFVYIFFKAKLKDKLTVVKAMLNPSTLLTFGFFIFGFSWIILLVMRTFNITFNFYVSVFALFLLMIPLSKVPKLGLRGSSILLSILRVVFDFSSIWNIGFLIQFIFMLVLFVFVRFFVLNLGFKLFSEPVYVENLKPGMLIAEDIYKEGDEYKKRALVPISFITVLFDKIQYKSIISHLPEGLNKGEIRKIKRLHSKGKFKPHIIMVYQTIPFAPFMFFGVLLTFIAQGNAIMVLRVLIENFI